MEWLIYHIDALAIFLKETTLIYIKFENTIHCPITVKSSESYIKVQLDLTENCAQELRHIQRDLVGDEGIGRHRPAEE